MELSYRVDHVCAWRIQDFRLKVHFGQEALFGPGGGAFRIRDDSSWGVSYRRGAKLHRGNVMTCILEGGEASVQGALGQ